MGGTHHSPISLLTMKRECFCTSKILYVLLVPPLSQFVVLNVLLLIQMLLSVKLYERPVHLNHNCCGRVPGI